MTEKQLLGKILYSAMALGLARGMSIGGVLLMVMGTYSNQCPFILIFMFAFMSVSGSLLSIPAHESCEFWLHYKKPHNKCQGHPTTNNT